MVKGVNKTVIEVNDTGSRMFERIVFYVTPQYGNLSSKALQKAARDFTFNYDEKIMRANSVRKLIRRKKIICISAVGGVLLAVAATVLLLIL